MNTAPIIDPPKTHNGGPADNDNTLQDQQPTPFELIKTEIEDLFGEAKNWADGEPITNQAMHDEVEKLHDLLHDAGKRADDARIVENEPFDAGKAEVQARYAPLISNTKSVKGKVVLGKEALAALLLPWRKKIADEKAAIAAAAKEEADRKAAEAQAAIRASSGNLAAREDAEVLLKDAKAAERDAKRADKAATTGTGLRTVWRCEVTDIEAALDHYYPLAAEQFKQLAEELARVDVSMGKREIPGFRVWGDKVAV